jgi:HPt (histidine-containing phosphotransfer) domain-containing protein
VSEPVKPDSVVDRHFDGDVRLFEAFRAASQLQFEQDLVRGDAALLTGDTQALRRIGHDLKTVLHLLGDEAGSLQAHRLEEAALAAARDDAAVRRAWQALRPALAALG